MDLMKLQNLLNECIMIEQGNYLGGNFSVDLKEAQLELDQAKQLLLHNVSFELPSDDIFDMPEVDLQNPLEEFYYYERPAYLEDDQKQFRERLQKALNYLKGN